MNRLPRQWGSHQPWKNSKKMWMWHLKTWISRDVVVVGWTGWPGRSSPALTIPRGKIPFNTLAKTIDFVSPHRILHSKKGWNQWTNSIGVICGPYSHCPTAWASHSANRSSRVLLVKIWEIIPIKTAAPTAQLRLLPKYKYWYNCN